MPRLSRKKEKSKIIKKKNTKKRTKKITTKKSLKGGFKFLRPKKKKTAQTPQTQSSSDSSFGFNSKTNNTNSRIITSNTKVQELKQLMEEYSKQIIRLIAGEGCVDKQAINNNIGTTGFYCEDNNYDIKNKIKELLNPIIENLEKENKNKLANLDTTMLQTSTSTNANELAKLDTTMFEKNTNYKNEFNGFGK